MSVSTLLWFRQGLRLEDNPALAAAIEQGAVIPTASSHLFPGQSRSSNSRNHVLFHFSNTPEEPLRASIKHFPWREDPKSLEAWQKGRTGYPIVDAFQIYKDRRS